MTNLEKLLRQINREHVYIQTHNFPDPDAIASAYGLQRLLAYRGIEATLCYQGKIDRYSTGKLVELTEMDILNTDDIEDMLTDEDEVILVDSQKGNSNVINITGDEIICVDHHPVNEKYRYRFTDIRPGVGACATIIAEYFFENDIPMDKKVATALTYGIRVDTNHLSRSVSKLDLEMIYRMFELCDHDTIHMLENSNLCFEDLLAYSSAISSIEVYDNISFADTGKDCPEALIANVSDFMLALKEVAFSVVYSVRESGIKLSVRSENSELDAGKIIAEALADVGSGGGHAAMAGGFIPFEGDAYGESLVVDGVKERFIEVIAKKRGKKL